ncbi:MAG TPA: HDIG domain-containing protein [Chloroflexota bacterium]|nr:HDIG domain-containing protein [Chloroflexota bacterium]
MDTSIRDTNPVSPRFRLRTVALPAANGAGLLAVLVAIFLIRVQGPSVRVGSVAQDTVVAQRTTTYMDRVATAARRGAAMAGVSPVYRLDTSSGAGDHAAAAFFSHLNTIASAPSGAALTRLRHAAPAQLSSAALQELLSLTPSDRRLVETRTLSALTQASGWHFDRSQLTDTEIGLFGGIGPGVTPPERSLISQYIAAFLQPTLVPDPAATRARQQAAAHRIRPVYATIYAGQVVVRRGDLVTPSVMERLDALGLQQSQIGAEQILATILFAATVLMLLFWYLRAFHPGVLHRPRILLLLDAGIVLAALGSKLLTPNHLLLPYALPVAAVPTFAAILMAPEACIAVALAMSLLAGWIATSSFELTMYYFVTSAAGVLAVRQVRELRQFILSGLYIAVFAFLIVMSFGLLQVNDDMTAIQDYLAIAALNGLLSASLALGGFAVLSQFFGVTTAMQLLELGQPNRPLLRRLMLRAPGTYNHSMVVAAMVERAAQDIGANELIARVGALYHDVGKTVNPHCFVENQLGMGNIHDELRPEESARLIRGHVTQGLRLGRQHNLPRVVLDAIAEHHGTTTIAYFLHRAREYGEETDVAQYTYPGPRPQSRETALIMLADGCESAVRASKDRAPEKVEEIVSTIFAERGRQGQLSECPLTLSDLEAARRAFLAVLLGQYHPRIEYPEPTPITELRQAL